MVRGFALVLAIGLFGCSQAHLKDRIPQEASVQPFPAERGLARFKQIRPEMSYDQVVALCGKPTTDLGSGLYLLRYDLPDGSSVLVSSDGKRVLSVMRGGKNILNEAVQ